MDGETTIRPAMAVAYPANLSIMYANTTAVPDFSWEAAAGRTVQPSEYGNLSALRATVVTYIWYAFHRNVYADYLRQEGYVLPGVCLFVCLSVCLSVSNLK